MIGGNSNGKKRYVQVGLGGRARFFYRAVAKDYGETSEIVGFCDVNQTRMDYANRLLQEDGEDAAGHV